MMAIDTLGYVKYLEAQGVPRAMAEAHAEAVNRYLFPELATKADLSDLKVWLISAMVAVAGLSLAIAKFT
jgi:hypothetical protein